MARRIEIAIRMFLVLTAVATAARASDDEVPVHGLSVHDLAHTDVTKDHGLPAMSPNSIQQQAGSFRAPDDKLVSDQALNSGPSSAAPTGPCNETTCCFSQTSNTPASFTIQARRRPSEESEPPELQAQGPSAPEEVPCHQPLSPDQPLASGFAWMRLNWHRLWRQMSELWVWRQLAQLRQQPLELLALPAVSPLPAIMVHRGPRMASGEEWAPGGPKGAQGGTEAAGQGSEYGADSEPAGLQERGPDMDAVERAAEDEEMAATAEATAAEPEATLIVPGADIREAASHLPDGAEQVHRNAPGPQEWQLQEQMAADMAGMWDDGEDLDQEQQPTDLGQQQDEQQQQQQQQRSMDPRPLSPSLPQDSEQRQLGADSEQQQWLEADGLVASVPEGKPAAPQYAIYGLVQPPLPEAQPRPHAEAQPEAPPKHNLAASQSESGPVAAAQDRTQVANDDGISSSGPLSQQAPLPQPRLEAAAGQGSEPGSGDMPQGREAGSADLQGTKAGAPAQGRVAGDVLSELQAAGTPQDVAKAIDTLLAAGGADALLGAGGWDAGWLDAGRAPGSRAQLQQPSQVTPECALPVGHGIEQLEQESATQAEDATVSVHGPLGSASLSFLSPPRPRYPPRPRDPGSVNAEKAGAPNKEAAHGSVCPNGGSSGYAAWVWVAAAVLQVATVAGWAHSCLRLRAASKQLQNRDEVVRELQERLAVGEQAAVQLRGEQDAAEARGADLAARLDKALAEAGRERVGRAAAVAAAARIRQLHAAAMLQLAERVPELQRGQEALGRGVAEACQVWRAAGERVAEGLAAARGSLIRLAARGAEERRRAAAVLHAAKAAHAAEVDQLKEQHRQELQRQREALAARCGALRGLLREAAGQLGELRQRHRRNVAAWLVLRADTAVRLTAVQEQAGRLAAEHRAQAASARDRLAVQQGLLDHMGQQLQQKVVAVVAAQRYNSELEELLSQKDHVILEHIRELAATRAALDTQRSQCGVLQRTLQEGEEALAAAREEAEELRQRLGDTQASLAASEARCMELTAANELLDAQVAEFTESAALLAQLQERFVGPAQRREAALEAALAEAQEGAARAVAERDERLRALGEELAGANRDLEATQRQVQEARVQLEKRERELQTLQAEIAELSRREDEGVENSLAAVRQWEHDTAAQLLLPLPADVKGGPLALIAGPGGMGSGGGGLGTPGGPGGYGGGLGTPGGGGGMMGSSGGSSTSGVRGAGSFSFGSFRK